MIFSNRCHRFGFNIMLKSTQEQAYSLVSLSLIPIRVNVGEIWNYYVVNFLVKHKNIILLIYSFNG